MEQKFIFFDLEPAGLDPKRHAIIQIAAIAVDENLSPLEAFEAKVRFDKSKANKQSLRKNHYHPGIWAKEAIPEADAARRFAEFLRRHATCKTQAASGETYFVAKLVAHNAAFDGPFLDAWFERLGIFLPAKRPILCTLQRALWHFSESPLGPQPTDYKLATLCKFFGVPFHAASAHEALADVTATLLLYRAMTRRSQVLKATPSLF